MQNGNYIFYADVFFIQNLIVKVGVLALTIKTLKIPMKKPVMKMMMIASTATLLEIIGLFFIPNYTVFLIVAHVVIIPGMLAALLWRQREVIGKALVCSYFYVIFLNGVIEAVWNNVGGKGYFSVFVIGGVLFGGAVVLAFLRRWKVRKGIYEVNILKVKDSWKLKGFYDSGNQLRDPYTGKGVHIISEDVAKRILFSKEGGVWIPYYTVGNPQGLIEVHYVEQLEICKGKDKVIQKHVPLAVTTNEIFVGKDYEIIINEDVW